MIQQFLKSKEIKSNQVLSILYNDFNIFESTVWIL